MTHTLLLADDSITIQRVIELTFSGEDIEVIAVGDGDAAVDRFESDRPDIVLADISMPKRNGYEVAAYVRSRPGIMHVPVLLLAGAFETVDQARAEQVGCDGVLVKPFEPQQVVARVRELLARAEADRRRASRPAPLGPAAAVAEVPPPAPAAVVAESPSPGVAPRVEKPVAPLSHPAPELESAVGGAPGVPRAEAPPTPVPDPMGGSWFASETSADVPGAVAAAMDETEMPFASETPVAVPVEPAPVTPPARPPSVMAPPAPPARTGDPLEDYFGRLGSAVEAFGSAGRAPYAPKGAGTAFDDPWTYGEVPTVSGLLDPSPPDWPGAARFPDGGVADRPSPSRDAFAPDRLTDDEEPLAAREPSQTTSFIADAFHALLESEQGLSRAVESRTSPAAPSIVPGHDVSDELVERVTQRVIERLVPHAARDMVASIVSDVAERLVREEIARARTRAEGRQ